MAKNKKNTCPPCKKTSIGGQALMEGIMMRGPEKTAMAVRNAKGEIILETNTNKAPSRISKIPFLRGIVNMGSSLAGGYKYLMRSADIALADAEEADRTAKAAKAAAKAADGTPDTPEVTEAIPETPDTPEVTEAIPETPDTPEVTEAIPETPDTPEVTEAIPETPDTPEVIEEAPASNEKAKKEKPKKENSAGATTTVVMIIGVILGVALALGLFIALPSYIFKGFAWLVGIDVSAIAPDDYGMNLLRSAFEGVLKIIILVAYMALVSLMKDIRRVFMYHGAEHKTIFCYEAGLELTVENVRTQRRFHPRCGTSFIILVLLVSILLGFFIPATIDTWLRVIIKIALLPLTIGIGYELIKLAGRKDNLFTRIISAPGVWLQHITTVEPDDSMIECAIAAMNEVIPEDKNADNW